MIDRWKNELTILGALLTDKANTSYIFSELSEDYFEEETIAGVFRKARKLWKETGSNDFSALANSYTEEESNITDNIYMVYMPSIETRPFVDEFKKSVLVEKIKDTAEKMLRTDDLDEITNCDTEIQNYLRGASRIRPMSFADYISNFANRMTTPIEAIKTGFGKFDQKLLIERGDFIILMGEQSAGKTALSIGMAVNMAKQGHNVYYYSLETSDNGVFDRANAIYTGAKLGNILRHDLTEDDMTRVGEKMDEMEKLPFHVVEAATWNVSRIANDAVANKADVIFIDYVGLLKGSGRSRYEEMTNISTDLHTMAQHNKITVIALSQMNRESNNERDSKKIQLPTMHDAKDTGQLESDADAMIALKRRDAGKDRFEKSRWRTDALIVKNKKGMLGNIAFWFDGETQRFTEVSDRELDAEKIRVVKREVENIRTRREEE